MQAHTSEIIGPLSEVVRARAHVGPLMASNQNTAAFHPEISFWVARSMRPREKYKKFRVFNSALLVDISVVPIPPFGPDRSPWDSVSRTEGDGDFNERLGKLAATYKQQRTPSGSHESGSLESAIFYDTSP